MGRRPVLGRSIGLSSARVSRPLRVASTRPPSRRFFSPRSTQQVRSRAVAMDWLGGVAMLIAVVAWGTLLSLLGS
jgi:hypothetical protein